MGLSEENIQVRQRTLREAKQITEKFGQVIPPSVLVASIIIACGRITAASISAAMLNSAEAEVIKATTSFTDIFVNEVVNGLTRIKAAKKKGEI